MTFFVPEKMSKENKFMAFQCRFFCALQQESEGKVAEENEWVFNSKFPSQLTPPPFTHQTAPSQLVYRSSPRVTELNKMLKDCNRILGRLIECKGKPKTANSFLSNYLNFPHIMLIKSCKRESICPMTVSYFPATSSPSSCYRRFTVSSFFVPLFNISIIDLFCGFFMAAIASKQ